MNIKRILAAASASVVAVSAMSVTGLTSFAETVSSQSNLQIDLFTDNVGYDLSKVATLKFDFTYDASADVQEFNEDGTPKLDDNGDEVWARNWFGGNIYYQGENISWTEGGSWGRNEWSVDISTETVEMDISGFFTGSEEWAQLFIGNFSNGTVSDVDIENIQILDSNGNVLPDDYTPPSDDDDSGDDGDSSSDSKTEESKPEESKPEESKPDESKPVDITPNIDTTSKIKPAHEQDVPDAGKGPAAERPVPGIGMTDRNNGGAGNSGDNSGNSGDSSTPSDPSNPSNPNTGVAMAFAPALLAGAAVVVAKKRK